MRKCSYMRSQGWNPNSIWLVALKEERRHQGCKHTKKRPPEDTARRQPYISQGGVPRRNQLCWHLDLEQSISRTMRNEFTQSMVFGYGSNRELIQEGFKLLPLSTFPDKSKGHIICQWNIEKFYSSKSPLGNLWKFFTFFHLTEILNLFLKLFYE